MKNPPTIEFLFWKDCVSHSAARQLLQVVMEELGLDVPVREVQVVSEEDAIHLQFPGSPTIRVDSKDIDPVGAKQMEIALTCRLYRLEDGRPSPLPSKEMIHRALAEMA